MFDLVLNMPVKITLHLTFFKRTVYRKLMNFFKVLPKETKILLVHVKDKSHNSLQDFRPATLLKRDSKTGAFL